MNNSNRSVGEIVTDAIRKKALALFEEKPQEEKKPSNIGLYMAWLGFNFIFLVLDTGTAFMVGSLTNPFYGFLVFMAGVSPFMLYEAMFTRAWNNSRQKWLSIIGAAVSILSTITLAVIVGTINAIKFFQITTLPVWTQSALELTLMIGLILAGGVHGLIWIVYFFGDEGITRKQVHTQNIAKRERKNQDFAMAQDDVKGIVELAKIVQQYENTGQIDLLSVALEKLTGNGLNIQDVPIRSFAQQAQQPHLDEHKNGEHEPRPTNPPRNG